jgi:hypothetical protein
VERSGIDAVKLMTNKVAGDNKAAEGRRNPGRSASRECDIQLRLIKVNQGWGLARE